jgi:hypothetical protein
MERLEANAPAGLVKGMGKTGAPAEVGLVMLRLCVYTSFSVKKLEFWEEVYRA